MIFIQADLSNQDGANDTRHNHLTSLDPPRLEQINTNTSLYNLDGSSLV